MIFTRILISCNFTQRKKQWFSFGWPSNSFQRQYLSLSLSHIGPRTALAKWGSSGLVEEFRGALQIDSVGATVWPAVGWSPMASCGTVRATPDGLRATKHAPRSRGSTFQGTGCGGWAGLVGRRFRVKLFVLLSKIISLGLPGASWGQV